MLNLDTKLTLDERTINAPNLCDRFSDEELGRIGSECWTGYDQDERSRDTWMKRNEAGMNLALQVAETKTFPWPDCANVQFPLVTIAAMQFHARAYPAIIAGDQVVKGKVLADDPDGLLAARADKVATKMNTQIMYEDQPWEEQEDKAIFNVSIVGTNFKKSYRSAAKKHNVSELVLAKNLVMNYWAKSVNDCPRKTHKIPMFRNEVYENIMRGVWRDVSTEAWYTAATAPPPSQARTEQDNRQGVKPPPSDDSTSLLFLEQHNWLDLDQDGYAEPYLVTFEATSKCVVRIVTRFDSESDIERVAAGENRGKIIQIKANEYFTKKTFIPSPDGGIYDIGFGVFLGPLNEATNSCVNMLLDAGTLQTTSGGFLGRGAKIRGGNYAIAPFEWKRVDSTGDDLRKSIYPLPVNAPSDVLFQLLSLLINYASRVSGTTDITVGENVGQNTPAQTAQTMAEMGQKIYTAIFKRIWRSLKEEFEKLYALNARYLPPGERELFQGKVGYDICPVADPNVTSDSTKVQLASAVVARASSAPGYDRDAVEVNWLKSMHVDNVKTLFPGTKGAPPPEDPKVTLEKLKQEGLNQRLQLELQNDTQQFVMTMMEERSVNQAKIIDLQASAREHAANAENEAAYAQVALINAEIAHRKNAADALNTRIDHYLQQLKIQSDHIVGLKSAEKTKVAA